MKKTTAIVFFSLAVFAFALRASAAEPSLSAESAILIEAESGNVIYEKNADARLPMASTTKIMTALVAIETTPLNKVVRVSAEAAGIEGSSVHLIEGEELTMGELLSAMMLESANDAAVAVAVEVAGSTAAFAGLMNAKAEALGLCDTHFMNPHGLSEDGHYTTARDLAKLTAYALENEAFAEIVSTYRAEIPYHGDEGTRTLINHNRLLKQSDNVIGVKTGFTKKSGRCLVTAAEENGVRVVAVTLNDPDDWRDHLSLHELGLSSYERVPLAEIGQYTCSVAALGAEDGELTLSNTDALSLILPKGSAVDATVLAPHYVFTDVSEGDEIGKVVFSCGGKEIASLPLTAAETVTAPQKEGFIRKIINLFGVSWKR